MVYFALALSDNAIHFRCNAAAAPGVLPRGGGRRSRSHASGSLLYTSFLDHCTLVKRNLAIGLTTDRRIKIDCKWKGTRASLDARNVSSGRVLAAAASSSVSEGTVTVSEVPGASPPTTTGGESLVEEENAAAAEENTSVADAPTSCVETTDEEEATEASSVDTPTKPMMQQTSKLSGRSNGHATAAAAAKKLKIRTIQKEELIPEAVFAGKIRAVQAYGALVDIGAFTDGLLHISQLSSNYVSQVQDVISVGQEVIVRVVDVDEMAGKITLTMRDETKVAEDHQQTQTLKENQSGDASQGCQQEDAVSKRGKITGKKSRERGKRDEQKQKVGKLRKNQELQGKVKKIIRSGAIVELLDHGEEGFIRSSSLAVGGDENFSAETLLLHVGQEVKVRIAKIEKGKVILTMMPEEEKEAEEVVMKSINNSINKIANVVEASKDDAFQLNFQIENSIGNRTQASEESSIQKSALPEEQASPEIQEATAEDQVKDVISEQPPLASDLVGATTEGSVINKNGDVGVLNPFELDSSMPTKLIGNATQVASAAIEKLSKLVEEQASAELVEETEFQGEDVVLVQQTILGDFVEATAGIGIVPEEPQAKLSDTNKEFFNPAEDAMGAELVEAELVEAEEEGIEKVACEESANGKFVLPEEQASAELEEETEFQGEDVVPVQQTILGDFVEATAGIGIVPEEPQAKRSDTNKEFFNPAEDAMGAELVEAEEEGIEKVACEETANGRFVLPEEQASAELEEGTEDKAQDMIPEQQHVANLMEATAEGIDAVSEDKLEATLAPDEESRAESWIDKNKELLDAGKDEIGAALVDAAEEIENQVAFEKSFSMEKLGLSEEQASMEFAEEKTQDKAQDALLDQQLVTDLAEATEGIDVVSEYERETGMSPDEEQPIAILSDINKGLVVDSAADRIDAELVDATTEVSENDETQVVSKEWLIERFKLAEKQASAAELEEEAKDKVQDVIPEAKGEAQDVIPEQQPVAKLAEATDGIDVMMEDVLKMAGMTIGKELGPELGATNEELTDSAEDRISTSLVEMTAVIENDTNIVSKEPPVDRLEMSEEQAFAELHEEAEDEAANVIPEQEPVAAELAEEGTDRIDVLIEDELQARITQDEEFRAELSDTNKELVDSAQDRTSADLVEATSGIENHTQVVSKEPPVDTRLELPEEQASIEDKAEDFTPEEQPVANLRAATEGIYVTTINELEIGMSHDEEPTAEFSDTKKEFVDAVEDKICAELVETMEGIENDTWMVWEESSIDRLGLPEEQTSAMLEEEIQEDYKAEETPVVVGLAEAVDGGIEVANEDELVEAGITHDAEESRAKLIDTIEELVDSAQDKIGAELVETTGGMGDNTKEVVSRDLSVERLELSEEKAFAELEEETEPETDKNLMHELKSVTAELVEATEAIEFVIEESGAAKLSDTKKELVDSAYKKAGVELVEAATRGIENVFEVKVELTSTLNHQLADAQIDKELVEAVPTLEKTDQLAAEDMTIKNKLDAIMEEKQEEVSIPVYPEVHSKPIGEAEATEMFAPSLAMHVQVSEIAATNLAAAGAETEETMRIPEAGRPSPLIPGAFALDTDSMTNAVFLDPLVEPKHSPTTVISGWQHLWCQFLGTR
ncbi:unnamed protein product [Sphagnum jensenii]|uniref:S1 motif domain-containing protein n=1 Tax=Sphagnum jensenii TaxID=128206 RepID=A0ABP1B4Y7_9BRYO